MPNETVAPKVVKPKRTYAFRDGRIVEVTGERKNQVRTLIKMGWNAPAR